MMVSSSFIQFLHTTHKSSLSVFAQCELVGRSPRRYWLIDNVLKRYSVKNRGAHSVPSSQLLGCTEEHPHPVLLARSIGEASRGSSAVGHWRFSHSGMLGKVVV